MEIRAFNRNHIRRMGALDRQYLQTQFTVQEARTLWEIHNDPGLRAADIQQRTGMEQAQISRILKRLSPFIEKTPHPTDGRAQSLQFTSEGRSAFQELNEKSNTHADWPNGPQARQAMQFLDALWDKQPATIRHGTMGDLGIAFGEQCRIYRRQHGYSEAFETYFCEGLHPFLKHFDPNLDRLWVAEIGSMPVGWIAIQYAGNGTAKLRWFLVKEEAQGQGLGSTLLSKALQFAWVAGYERIELWTVDDLPAARRLYERAGFVLAEEKHDCPWKAGAREQKWILEPLSEM